MAKLKDYYKPVVEFPKKDEPKPSTPKEPEVKPQPSNSKPEAKFKVSEPKVSRDEQGNIQRLELPDGRSFSGLKPAEYLKLLEGYKGSSPAKAQQPITQQEKFQAAFDLQQSQESFMNAQQPIIPPNVTAEQLASVGQVDQSTVDILADPLNPSDQERAQILANQQARENINKIPIVNLLGKISNTALGVADKFAPGVKEGLLNNIDSFPKLKAYLNDYSNKDQFRSVQADVKQAQQSINFAIALANQPGNSDLAIETYNNAVTQLRRAEKTLKILEQDPKAYVDNVKLERQELQNYLDNVQPGKDLRMRNALIKPDPNYYDNQINQIITG